MSTLTPLANEVLKKRYLARNYRGEIIESPADVFARVARVVVPKVRPRCSFWCEDAIASISALITGDWPCQTAMDCSMCDSPGAIGLAAMRRRTHRYGVR